MAQTYPKALYIVRLMVENASIISSHLTWGFPAPSAFTGFMHNLQRQLNVIEAYQDVECCGIGIISHQFNPQITKSNAYRYSPYQLNLARHPLKADGSTPAMIEEGKGHFEVSLIIGLGGEGLDQHLSANDGELAEVTQTLIQTISQRIYNMRLAGGSIFSHKRIKPMLVNWSLHDAENTTQKLRYHLLPGFALQHRHQVLLAHQQWLKQYLTGMQNQAEPNLLDTVLDIQRLNFVSTAQENQDENAEKQGIWQVRPRPQHLKGWLVPIPIGYAALTDLQAQGVIKGLRHDQYPATFVEAILSLGEWQSPHHLKDIVEILWNYNSIPKNGVYEITQPFAPKPTFQHSSMDEEEHQSFEFDLEEEEN